MNKSTPQIFLISGPLGVGKSTLAQQIANDVKGSVYLEGDFFFRAMEELQEDGLSWKERLETSWEQIISACGIYAARGMNVVVDFVAEADFELERFVSEIFDHAESGKYSVLVKFISLDANEDTIRERLSVRGDSKYLERSLEIREKISKSEFLSKFALPTDNSTTKELARKIVDADEERFNLTKNFFL